MRVVVTGSGGQLGREFAAALVVAGHDVVALAHADLDVAEPAAVADMIGQHRPGWVVNCAAWTRVDDAESAADAVYRVNAVGPRVLAVACHQHSIQLCHVSTDFVFNGTADRPLDEWAASEPLSVYGLSKLAGEKEVRRHCPRHVIIRSSWLYGQMGPNFVLTMLRLAREKGALRVVADQHGTPTWTGHLAPAMIRVLERDVMGTIHLSNAGMTSWHGFAEAIVAEAGLGDVPVEAIATDDYPTPARRPAYSVLDNRVWRLLGEAALPPWRDGLRAYLRSQSLAAVDIGVR